MRIDANGKSRIHLIPTGYCSFDWPLIYVCADK